MHHVLLPNALIISLPHGTLVSRHRSTLRLTYPPELARLTALVRLCRQETQSSSPDAAAPIVVVEILPVDVDGVRSDVFAALSLFELLKLQLATPADQVTEAMRTVSLLPSRRFAA